MYTKTRDAYFERREAAYGRVIMIDGNILAKLT